MALRITLLGDAAVSSLRPDGVRKHPPSKRCLRKVSVIEQLRGDQTMPVPTREVLRVSSGGKAGGIEALGPPTRGDPSAEP